MACDHHTPKILNMKLRRVVITHGVFLPVQACIIDCNFIDISSLINNVYNYNYSFIYL